MRLLGEWAADRGLLLDQADVAGWHNNLPAVSPPKLGIPKSDEFVHGPERHNRPGDRWA